MCTHVVNKHRIKSVEKKSSSNSMSAALRFEKVSHSFGAIIQIHHTMRCLAKYYDSLVNIHLGFWTTDVSSSWFNRLHNNGQSYA